MRAAPRFELLLLFLFAITYVVNIVNLRFYVSLLRGEVESAVIDAYVLFSILGFIVFVLVASPLIYWPYIYASELSPRARQNAVCAGIALCFFLHDLPVSWIEIYLVSFHGWGSVLSGVSLFLACFCLVIGFFVTWLGYAWVLCGLLQFRYGVAPPMAVSPRCVSSRV